MAYSGVMLGVFFRCCLQALFQSDFGSVWEPFGGPSWGSKSAKNVRGLSKISIFRLSLQRLFREPSRGLFGTDLGPKTASKSVPNGLSKRPRTRDTKRAPQRAGNWPQDPPQEISQERPQSVEFGGPPEKVGSLTRRRPRDPLRNPSGHLPGPSGTPPGPSPDHPGNPSGPYPKWPPEDFHLGL